jgi:hypothetical protein
VFSWSSELGWGILVLLVDSGELEDGAQVAPVAAFGACDRGLDSLEFVFFLALTLGSLSLLRSWGGFYRCPTAAPWADSFAAPRLRLLGQIRARWQPNARWQLPPKANLA